VGLATPGAGGSPGGAPGGVFVGTPGATGTAGAGIGGGLFLTAGGKVVIDNTNVTGNHASTSDADVNGTFAT
jgi:hypothetical protein